MQERQNTFVVHIFDGDYVLSRHDNLKLTFLGRWRKTKPNEVYAEAEIDLALALPLVVAKLERELMLLFVGTLATREKKVEDRVVWFMAATLAGFGYEPVS